MKKKLLYILYKHKFIKFNSEKVLSFLMNHTNHFIMINSFLCLRKPTMCPRFKIIPIADRTIKINLHFKMRVRSSDTTITILMHCFPDDRNLWGYHDSRLFVRLSTRLSIKDRLYVISLFLKYLVCKNILCVHTEKKKQETA